MCIAALPYAYWHHMNGTLDGTIDAQGSEALYWFSPDHRINPEPRDFANTSAASKEIPNMWIHKPLLDKSRWTPPPMRDHFWPHRIGFDKPTVVICNRYNPEWGRTPVNYLDLDTLRRLFDLLSAEYQVVYVNIRGREELEDNAHSMDLGDYEMIAEEYPQVSVIHDIVSENGGDFNEVQCRVFAGCSKFITMNGGHSILCSYFGGENIIYTKECRELWPTVNSFYNWYPDLGGSIIKVVNTHEDLINMVRSKWVDKDPLINILVRCHNRERGLERLYSSIAGQNYINWNVVASYDDAAAWRYLCKYPFQKVRVGVRGVVTPIVGDERYGRPLPANLYLNEMAHLVKDGYIMYLDDDDLFCGPESLKDISEWLDPDKVTLWRAIVPGSGRRIPSDDNWEKVVAGDISGIAFAYHHKHKDLAQWEPYRRGDYRVIRSLTDNLGAIWVDATFTVIGVAPSDKLTVSYLAEKKREHLELIDRINRDVARKKLEGPTGTGKGPLGPKLKNV